MERANIDTKLAVLIEKVTNIEGKVTKMETRLDNEFVTRGELRASIELMEAKNCVLKEHVDLLKKIVYGQIGVILTAFTGAVLAFIINKP